MARRSSWLDLGILANMARGSQEQPRSSRRTSWLDLGIQYLGKPTGSSWQLGWGAGNQEQPRKLQEQPKSTQEWPRRAPG